MFQWSYGCRQKHGKIYVILEHFFWGLNFSQMVYIHAFIKQEYNTLTGVILYVYALAYICKYSARIYMHIMLILLYVSIVKWSRAMAWSLCLFHSFIPGKFSTLMKLIKSWIFWWIWNIYLFLNKLFLVYQHESKQHYYTQFLNITCLHIAMVCEFWFLFELNIS